MPKITLENWESARGEKSRRPRGPKPVAQGQLLQSTAWLDGDLIWHEGALGWQSRGQITVPDDAQIERAGRALDKLEARGIQRATAATRRDKWRLARKLGALRARDLDKLCAVSRRRNPAALQRLAPLVVLESLKIELPQSPTLALFKAWPHSRNALESIVGDENWPAESRELAAFVFGAAAPAQIACLPKPARAVAALGARFQGELKTPFAAPQLLLCAALESEALGWRFVNLVSAKTPFAPDVLTLQRLARAHGIERALEIGEAFAALELDWPPLPEMGQPEGAREEWLEHEARVLWRRTRRELSEHWQRLLPLLAQREPEAVGPFLELSQGLLQVAAELYPSWVGKGKRRRKMGVPRIESAALNAYLLRDMTRWIGRLGNEVTSAPDPTVMLRLWHEVALHHARQAAAPLVREATDCLSLISSRWFATLKSNCQKDMVGLTRVARVGGLEIALGVWCAQRHHELGSARGRDASSRWPAQVAVESWLRVLKEIPDFKSSPWEWNRLLKRCGAADARGLLWRIVEATRGVPSLTRAQLIEGLHWWHPTRANGRIVWPHLPAVMRAIARPLSQWENDDICQIIQSICEVCALAAEAEIAPPQWPALALVVIEVWESERAKDSDFYWQEYAPHIALLLCNDELKLEENAPALLRSTLENVCKMLADKYKCFYEIQQNSRIAQGRPFLARALRYGVEIAPARTLDALEYLGALKSSHQLDALQTLETPAPELNASWREIAAISPAIADIARDCASWQTLAGEENDPPPGLAKITDWPRKWAREIEALQTKVADNPKLSGRLDNLRARLADEPKWRAQQTSEIAELLENATKRAAFSALERVIENAFRARLQDLCGVLPAEFAFDDDWFNALLLGSDVEYNRKWARALLRHEVAGNADWRQQLPGNARFLEELAWRGVDTKFYLSEFGRACGELWLWIENRPLHILQMGNRFNTCLSRGGCNAFAGVANAIELNKRVVYARDKKGHIVARQLWAISAEFRLIGFDVYSTYSAHERAGLEAHFAAHARQWARSCGLELANAGEVENLVAPQWYNDGVRAWEGDLSTVAQSSARGAKATVRADSSTRVA